ncbi:stage II sporulation protein M [Flagellimonas meridianipacifica]|uniref:Putative membrane protein SpoIIM required for sporulation n=1 Tax=Flagellimonas meridianipacifica TaxID=1080225 RepID=A0A2T0MDB6_9FLAO|nr:stage II sporulation protein M [Allomuricauda pacifica]PRX55489.1 putative membrane protein SpoIIM required for sporulation [Allomuricauda pacifica]
MREAAFVKQNKEKWIAFEKAILNGSSTSPDELADGYIQLTNDLAYAQTYYAESKTLLYLNSLASQAHQRIYKNKKESRNRIIEFWGYEFPLFFKQYHKTLFTAFLIFAVATSIGSLSALNDGSFVRLILGDAYVNLTLENIAKGEPTAIYKSGSEVGTFLGITINNIRVALIAFAFGVITSIGTAYVLFSNGIMLGAFVTFFYTKGVFFEANRQIWLHGTIEISVIIIAGCAGLIMGNSILFPKTFSRRVSFMKGAKDGLKVVVSTIPFFIIAGFIEGFITRYADMPDWLAFLIIGGSLALIVFYYIIYPITLNTLDGKQIPRT